MEDGKAPIHIMPKEVIFNAVEANKNYEMPITIRNNSKKAKKIRFSDMKTSKFHIL